MANKRYDQFAGVAPTTTRITLTADPATGALGKTTIADLLALQPTTNMITYMQALGSPIKSAVYGFNPLFINGSHGTSFQTMFFQIIPCPAFTATGVWYQLTTVGVFPSSGYTGFGLYSQTAGTMNLIASTANASLPLSSGATGFRQVAFVSTVALTQDCYWLAYLYSPGGAASQTPTIATCAGSQVAGITKFGMSNGVKFQASKASVSTLPSSQAFSTTGDTTIPPLCIGLY